MKYVIGRPMILYSSDTAPRLSSATGKSIPKSSTNGWITDLLSWRFRAMISSPSF